MLIHSLNLTTSIEVKELSLTFLQQGEKVSGSCQAMMAVKSHFPEIQTAPRDMTCVHLAAWFGLRDITAALLEKGYDPNARDTFGRTPWLYAVKNGHVAVVKLLVESSADTTAKDDKDHTALHLAALRGYETIVEILLENGADVEAKTAVDEKDFYNDLSELPSHGHPFFIIRGRSGCTALHWAAAKGHRAVVKLLLDHGANISSKTGIGIVKTGIGIVKTAGGQTALQLSAGQGHIDVLELLLQKGADIAARDASRGAMALHYAAHNGHEPAVRLLLERGTEVNQEDLHGGTALHDAAHNGHYEVARLLIEKGANIEAETEFGWGGTVLYGAACHDAIVGLLIEKKVDVNRKDNYGTALHYMAQVGNAESIRLMLENGADIDAKNSGGETALHIAEGSFSRFPELISLLVAKGANIYAKDNQGRMPGQWWP
jgi:ankyrin repeat protein